MPAPKTLLAHVLEGTFIPYRHGDLLESSELPEQPPGDSTRSELPEAWGALRTLAGAYGQASYDRERQAIAKEFSDVVKRIAELRHEPTTLYEHVTSVIGPHPRTAPDVDPGARVAAFFEQFLVHVKGRWAGQAFTLEPWQRREIIDPLFAVDESGLRLRREGYYELSKKNGKSGLAAGVGAYLLCADDEPGAHVFSGAVDKDQARIVFQAALQMIDRSPLRPWVRIHKDAISVPSHDSVWKVLSADAISDEGIDLHGGVIDELHHHERRELYDLFARSGLAREQPLVVTITNAPADPDPDSSVCAEVRAQALAALRGDDDARDDLAAFVPELTDAELDQAMAGDMTVAKRVNPASWITETLLGQTRRRVRPAAFRRYHLNRPGRDETEHWLPAGAWDACAGEVDIAPGDPVYVGLDYASRHDCAAIVEVCPKDDRLHVRAHVFAVGRDKQTPPAHMIVDGDRITHALIEDTLFGIAREQSLELVVADPWRLSRTLELLDDQGITTVEMPQTNERMCPAAQGLFNSVAERRIVHDADPVLRAHIRNSVAREVGPRGWRLDKDKRRSPMDAAVALAMALAGLEAAPPSDADAFLFEVW